MQLEEIITPMKTTVTVSGSSFQLIGAIGSASGQVPGRSRSRALAPMRRADPRDFLPPRGADSALRC
jgi:hypothetical protein